MYKQCQPQFEDEGEVEEERGEGSQAIESVDPNDGNNESN